MGQGAIAATPMQMHSAMGAIANGGVLLEPQLFREVRDEDDKLVFSFADQPRRRVITERTASTMARLLMGVASPEGTARAISRFAQTRKKKLFYPLRALPLFRAVQLGQRCAPGFFQGRKTLDGKSRR